MIYFAFILIVAGFALRYLAYRTLGREWSLELHVPDKIIINGIYKFIRHPSYLGSIMIMAGLTLIDVRLSFICLVFAFFLARIMEEEKYLNQYDDYIKLKKTTGMFFPKIRR